LRFLVSYVPLFYFRVREWRSARDEGERKYPPSLPASYLTPNEAGEEEDEEEEGVTLQILEGGGKVKHFILDFRVFTRTRKLS